MVKCVYGSLELCLSHTELSVGQEDCSSGRTRHKLHERSWEKTPGAVKGNLPLSSTEWQQAAETTAAGAFSTYRADKLCVTQTHCRGRRVQSPPSPFRRTIPGRHRDESKLCLTNTLVLFSLHGKLARTADIIRSKTIFFLNISLPLSLPPSQADVHSYSSVVYPIRVVRQLQSIWSFFCTL